MSPLLEKLMDEVQGAWRYRWAGLGAAWLVAMLGWLYVFALPDNYEAQARVFVDTRTVLRPALQGLALNEDLNAELNYVRQALLAGPQLLKIAQEAGMLPALLERGAADGCLGPQTVQLRELFAEPVMVGTDHVGDVGHSHSQPP